MLYKNTAGQKIGVFAYTASTGAAKTGDAANITCYESIGFAAADQLDDANPTELDATNMPGWYVFDLTQAETNGEVLIFAPKSSTSGVVLDQIQVVTEASLPQTGDAYAIVNHADYGNAKLVRSTTPANTLDVSATGEAGLDFANIKDATGAHTLTNITVPTVTTVGTTTNLTNLPAAAALEATLTDMKGAGYTNTTDTLEKIRDAIPAAAPSAADNATAAAAAILVTPANKLETDASGHVSISGTKNTLDSLSGADGDTLKDLSDEIAAIAVGAGLTAQEVRDAMKLAPTAGAPAAGSVDAHLDDILEDTGTTLDGLIDAIKAKTDALDVTGTPAVVSLVDGGDLTVIAGATFDPPAITGLTIPATWETGFFTVKAKKEGSGLVAAADSTALIQVKVSNPADGADGLLYLNAAAASSAAYGSLALDATAGTATIVVADDATVLLARRAGLFWDIKTLNSDGTSDVVCSGSLEVVLTPTKTV